MKTSTFFLLLMIGVWASSCNTRSNQSTEPQDPPATEVPKTKTSEEILDAVAKANDAIALRYGTSFGMCQGYCLTEMKVTSKGIQHVRSDWPTRNSGVEPITTGIEYSVEKYEELLATLDMDAFFAMDSVYGCPDCADGGSEWIEVMSEGATQKVTIEFGKSIEGLTGVMSKLRKIGESVPRPNRDK